MSENTLTPCWGARCIHLNTLCNSLSSLVSPISIIHYCMNVYLYDCNLLFCRRRMDLDWRNRPLSIVLSPLSWVMMRELPHTVPLYLRTTRALLWGNLHKRHSLSTSLQITTNPINQPARLIGMLYPNLYVRGLSSQTSDRWDLKQGAPTLTDFQSRC